MLWCRFSIIDANQGLDAWRRQLTTVDALDALTPTPRGRGSTGATGFAPRPFGERLGEGQDSAPSMKQAAMLATHADHTVWQDVYRPSTHAGDIYLKLTVINDVLIVSFKE